MPENLNIRVSREHLSGWLLFSDTIRGYFESLEVRHTQAAYLVIFREDSDQDEQPIYRVRYAQHLGTWQHMLGFRWVRDRIIFSDNGLVYVDGRVYEPD